MSVDMSSLGSSVQDAEFTGLLPLFLLSESCLREHILAESSIQMDNVNAPVKKQPTPAATAEATGTQLAETETHGQSTKEEKRRLKVLNFHTAATFSTMSDKPCHILSAATIYFALCVTLW
ncbi:hypothetical protein Tco_1542725 [Tanacetum coccineum]